MLSERAERLPAPERTMMDDMKAAHDKSEAEYKAAHDKSEAAAKAAHDKDKAEHDESTQAQDDETKKAWRR